jgi:DNA-binding MarR family transcriptional regulator
VRLEFSLPKPASASNANIQILKVRGPTVVTAKQKSKQPGKANASQKEAAPNPPLGSSLSLQESVIQENDDLLRLHHQVCFPLYAASRLMMQLYKPHLTPFGLTYPQYLVLLVLWETDRLSVKEIGEKLYLDSATVIQVLSNLNKQGIIKRFRTETDGRTVLNQLTSKGKELKAQIKNIPVALSCEFGNQVEQVAALRPLLFDLVSILDQITKKQV